MAAAARGTNTGSTSKVLFPINNPPSLSAKVTTKLRLVVFPHAGAAPGNYRSWRRALPLEVELIAVNLTGRGVRAREPFAAKLEDVVEEVLEALKTLPTVSEIPLVFYGHSMGSMVAYGVVRGIQKQRRKDSDSSLPLPIKLFVSGRRAPHVPMPEGVEPWSKLTEPELLDRIKRIGGTPDEILNNKELMDLFLPVLRSDFGLLDQYSNTVVEDWSKDDEELEVKLRVPVSYYGGLKDPFVSMEEGERWKEAMVDPSPFSTCSFNEGHFFVQQLDSQVIDSLMKDQVIRPHLQ